VNKQNARICVTVAGATGKVIQIVDESTGDGPARKVIVNSESFYLSPFAVAVLTL